MVHIYCTRCVYETLSSMWMWVLFECMLFSVTGSTCCFGENGLFLIFDLRWPRAVLFFFLKISEHIMRLYLYGFFYNFLCMCTYAFRSSMVDSLVVFLFVVLHCQAFCLLQFCLWCSFLEIVSCDVRVLQITVMNIYLVYTYCQLYNYCSGVVSLLLIWCNPFCC